MKYKAVIFDLDGTLTDTLEDLKNSVNYALACFGFPERTLDEVRCFVGNGVRRLIKLSVPENISDEVSEKCIGVFKEHYEANSCVKTKPYDGAIDLLKVLKDSGIKTAVVTNKMHSAAAEITRKFFGDLIEVTVGQVDGMSQKPQPDGVYKALEILDVAKGDAVYVGDSEVDCVTAGNAGLPCIGVTWGFRSREVLEQNGADFIVDSPEEILKFI